MHLMSYGGAALNQSTNYVAIIGYGKVAPIGQQSNLRQRAHRAPAFLTYNVSERRQHFEVYPARAYAGTTPDMDDALHAIFSTGGLRTLVGRLDPADSATEYQVQALVSSFGRTEDNFWQGEFEFPSPYWESTALFSSTTNAGTDEAFPSLAITTGTAATRYRVTVTDNTGRGLWGYPISIPIGGLTQGQVMVYQRGRSVPFLVSGSDLWVRVDVRPGVPATLDVYTSTAINNTTTAGALQLGQLDPATSTNTSWHFIGFDGSNDVAGCGVWQPGITHAVRKGYSYSFGQTADNGISMWGVPGTVYNPSSINGTSGKFDPISATDKGYNNDADSFMLITGVEITGVTGLTLSASHTSFVLKNDPTATDNATYDTTLNFGYRGLPVGQYDWSGLQVGSPGGVVGVAIGCEPDTQYVGDTFAIMGTPTVALDAGRVPTIAVSAGISALLVSGQVANTTNGTSLTLTDLLMDANTLTVDADAQQISVASGPWYVGDVAFGDPNRWLTLAPGANSLTDTLGVTLSYRNRSGV